MSYKFWDDFIASWKSKSFEELQAIESFLGWSNPCATPLMNSSDPDDYSLLYLPEPWWGNTESYPLNAVVINYNPGEGRQIQHHQQSTHLFNHGNYSDFVEDDIKISNRFSHTSKWHKSKRAARVFNTLKRLGFDLNGQINLNNYLSIELIPWHTTSITEIDQYIETNIERIFDHSFCFAAEQSRRIENPVLKNKVLVRISGKPMLRLLNQILQSGCSQNETIQNTIYTPQSGSIRGTEPQHPGKGHVFKFFFPAYSDVTFICIWGKNSRNDFPPNIEMDYIFKHHIV